MQAERSSYQGVEGPPVPHRQFDGDQCRALGGEPTVRSCCGALCSTNKAGPVVVGEDIEPGPGWCSYMALLAEDQGLIVEQRLREPEVLVGGEEACHSKS